MATKKSAVLPLPCGHKNRVVESFGLVTCGTCGAPEDPNRIANYRLSERVTLQPGDLIKVSGIRGYCVYHYAVVNQPSGDAIACHDTEGGRWGNHRTVFAHRVKRAPKRAETR